MKTAAWIYTVGLIVLAVVFSYRSADAQYDGAREIRNIAGFDAIQVGGDFDVEVRQGAQFLVEVIGEDDELDRIVTQLRGSTLEIRRGRGGGKFFGLFPTYGRIAVTMPELAAVGASGGAGIVGIGKITGASLRIAASGGADVMLNIDVAALEVATSGGADVNLSGSTDFAAMKTSGGSDLNASSLSAREIELQSSGGSELRVSVTGRLFGTVSGGSDAYYLGSPETVDVKVSGGGNLSGR
jgi:hypothetical protein